jgi:hypothetical protein
VRVFVAFPPSVELFDALRIGGEVNTAIAETPRLAEADYTLGGRLAGDQLEYAWHIQPPPSTDRLVTPLPVRTEWIGGRVPADRSRRLEDAILRVVRIRGWFQLESPPDEGRFPFRLGLKDVKTGKINTDGFTARFGDRFNVVLVGSPNARPAIEPRYVYVLVIDSFGNSSLMYPSRHSLAADAQARIDRLEPVIVLGAPRTPVTIQLVPPAGIDTWVLLTTSEPLSDPQILSFQGRNTRGVKAESTLARLLIAVGSSERVQYPATPTNWSIQKLLVRGSPGGVAAE